MLVCANVYKYSIEIYSKARNSSQKYTFEGYVATQTNFVVIQRSRVYGRLSFLFVGHLSLYQEKLAPATSV